MAYTKTNWIDHVQENKWEIIDNGDGTYTLNKVGNVTQEGTPVSATKMNNLEKQYDEVKAEVEKTGGASDIKPDWSNVKNKPSSFTPSGHSSTHASGGSDALTPSDIGAAYSSHNHDTSYAPKSHVHDTSYAPKSHVGAGGTSQHPAATTSVAGFMSSADKSKIDRLGAVSGTWSINVSISASGTYTKSFPLGSITQAAWGIVIAKGPSYVGVVAIAVTTSSYSIGFGNDLGVIYDASRCYSYTEDGKISDEGTFGGNNTSVLMESAYVSDSNLYVVFRNTVTAEQQLVVERLTWGVVGN